MGNSLVELNITLIHIYIYIYHDATETPRLPRPYRGGVVERSRNARQLAHISSPGSPGKGERGTRRDGATHLKWGKSVALTHSTARGPAFDQAFAASGL